MLSQSDSNDNGLNTGIWKSKSVLSFDVSDSNYMIESNSKDDVLYIEIEKTKKYMSKVKGCSNEKCELNKKINVELFNVFLL